MAGIEISLAWNMPAVLLPGDIDRCGPHGCYLGAEDQLGLAYGLTRWSDLADIDGLRVVRFDSLGGASLKEVVERRKQRTQVNATATTVYQLGQEVWLRDLTLGSWALTAAMLWRLDLARADPRGHALEHLLYRPDEVAIAVHVRYGGAKDDRTSYKATNERWLRNVLMTLSALSRNATATKVVFHVFTGAAVWDWLRAMPGDAGAGAIVVHGKEDVSGVQAFRHLAMADIVVCGHSSLCFHAALVRLNSLAIVPLSAEPFPYNICPTFLSCVGNDGVLSPALQLRFLDAIDRASLHRSRRCPAPWQ
jgi:hypothetical protein